MITFKLLGFFVLLAINVVFGFVLYLKPCTFNFAFAFKIAILNAVVFFILLYRVLKDNEDKG